MHTLFLNSTFPSSVRWIQLSSLFAVLGCLFLPTVSGAQVTFNGVNGQQYVNFTSEAIGSRSATISLPFTIASSVSTTVGSIAVLTTGFAGKDFSQTIGNTTCMTGEYDAATNCVVNVAFKPLAPGLRLGAVVFYSGAGRSGTVLASVPVYGIGAGPEAIFGPHGTQTNVGHGFVFPAGVAVDAAGDVFVTDLEFQEVFKIAPNGAKTQVGGEFDVPEAVAVDGGGNIYVADSEAAQVFKVTPGGVQTTVGTGFSYPNGIAVDGQGNLYVTDPFIDEVVKIPPSGDQSTVGSGYNTPAGVAIDASGNVYVADTYNQTVFKVTPGGTQTMIGKNLDSPAAVAVDAAGDVYITDDGTEDLYEVKPSGQQITVATNLDDPDGVAVDGAGNLYLADSYDEHAIKLDRADNPSLHFDTTKMGSTSKDSPRTVMVANIGNKPLKFSALSYPANFPEASADDDCASTTTLAAAADCALTIDFKPTASLGAKSSVFLTGAVKLATNTLNISNTTKQVNVSGTETK
jgi:large repetitive protein